MGVPVLIIGKSGAGKSTSLRSFGSDEIVLYNVAKKPLPFKGSFKNKADGCNYIQIEKSLLKKTSKTYVIDDSQYLMTFELFDKVYQKGYNKFTEMAVHFYNLVQLVINNLSPDVIVYFLHHTDSDESGTRAKTAGKMIDNQLTLEGLFSIVILAQNNQGKYVFITHSNGSNTVKTPMGMFNDDEIDNDLKAVDTAIREYYDLGDNLNAETKKL